jgi:hypothetical protein
MVGVVALPTKVRRQKLVDRGVIVGQHRGVAGPLSELCTRDHVPGDPRSDMRAAIEATSTGALEAITTRFPPAFSP